MVTYNWFQNIDDLNKVLKDTDILETKENKYKRINAMNREVQLLGFEIVAFAGDAF